MTYHYWTSDRAYQQIRHQLAKDDDHVMFDKLNSHLIDMANKFGWDQFYGVNHHMASSPMYRKYVKIPGTNINSNF